MQELGVGQIASIMGRYYVMDQNSTNGTFINGRIIKAGQETEILPGDCLMLANEEFIFNE